MATAAAISIAPTPVPLWTDTSEVRALIGRIKLNPPTLNVRELASFERWNRDDEIHAWYSGELVDRLEDARTRYTNGIMDRIDAAPHSGSPEYVRAVEALYAQPSLHEVISAAVEDESGWKRSAMGDA